MSDITPELLKTIDTLEGLEQLMDRAATPEIEQILQKAWLSISETFPEDFREATHEDAGAEGLRRYIRVKAFFENPEQNPISTEDLGDYYRNRSAVDEESADFFFPD